MLQDGMLAFALLGADWVLWLLVFMSVLVVAISFERALYFVRDATDRRGLQTAFDEYLDGGRSEHFRDQIDKLKGYQARVLTSGLQLAPHGGSKAAEKAMASTITAEKVRMERGLSVIATVGSNAPFVGLFGTVLGIIKAFHDLAVNTTEASEAVMAGISEALVATAVGLMVAIPAVVLYNSLIRFVRARQSRTESLANLVLACIDTEDPTEHDPAPAHGK
ncbi:MAG TPA: MotA/TolQ/ExbB proton channel family protein [Deltaproteobacteria bacterium]|nr:MotA/TolQ/ExbB proton channel family protein [Deltaproteobacteria bacterium]